MPRRGILIAAGGLIASVIAVGFLAGFLGARGETPAAGNVDVRPQGQGGADFFAEVSEVGDTIVVVDDNGEEHRFATSDITVTTSAGSTIDAIRAGDLVILALETDVFGGQAIRYVIVASEEVQARARP